MSNTEVFEKLASEKNYQRMKAFQKWKDARRRISAATEAYSKYVGVEDETAQRSQIPVFQKPYEDDREQ